MSGRCVPFGPQLVLWIAAVALLGAPKGGRVRVARDSSCAGASETYERTEAREGGEAHRLPAWRPTSLRLRWRKEERGPDGGRGAQGASCAGRSRAREGRRVGEDLLGARMTYGGRGRRVPACEERRHACKHELK